MDFSSLLDVGRRCHQVSHFKLLHQEPEGQDYEPGWNRSPDAEDRGRKDTGANCCGLRWGGGKLTLYCFHVQWQRQALIRRKFRLPKQHCVGMKFISDAHGSTDGCLILMSMVTNK